MLEKGERARLRAGEAEWVAVEHHLAERRVRVALDHPARGELRVGEELLRCGDPRARELRARGGF